MSDTDPIPDVGKTKDGNIAPYTIIIAVALAVIYILLVVYLCLWASKIGRIDIALITMFSAVNLPVLGPVVVWVFFASGAIRPHS